MNISKNSAEIGLWVNILEKCVASFSFERTTLLRRVASMKKCKETHWRMLNLVKNEDKYARFDENAEFSENQECTKVEDVW